MRYLGNKRRLLPKIAACAQRIGFERGTVCDLFAGTGVVGRYFRGLGNRVLSTDVMVCSHVFQTLFLELESYPSFARLRSELDLGDVPAGDECRIRAESTLPGETAPVLAVIAFLENELEPVEGLLTRQYSPAGEADRRYLRPERARRLDSILMSVRDWLERGLLDELEAALLLAATIDATDRIANISGTYGAYLKSWQQNTKSAVELRLPQLVAGPPGKGHRRDALEWIGEVDADLLYMDPPYNHRQYPANYNLLDVIARIPTEPDLETFEASIYGKTGLTPWKDRASPLCSQRGTECRDAFHGILKETRIPRVVISYSEEGIIARNDFEEMLAEYAGVARTRLKDCLTEVAYPRFRSDADGRVSSIGTKRSYRQLPGRKADEVHEWLFHVARKSAGRSRK